MNLQELFDRVVTHLLTQNEKSTSRLGCRYRLAIKNGPVLKCAIGCLIDDEKYNSSIETRNINTIFTLDCHKELREKVFGEIIKVLQENIELFNDLQECHDELQSHDWSWRLLKIAKEYSLNTDAILKFKTKTSNAI